MIENKKMNYIKKIKIGLIFLFSCILFTISTDTVEARTLVASEEDAWVDNDFWKVKTNSIRVSTGEIIVINCLFKQRFEGVLLTSKDAVQMTLEGWKAPDIYSSLQLVHEDSILWRAENGWSGMQAYYYSDPLPEGTYYITFSTLTNETRNISYEIYKYPSLTTAVTVPTTLSLKTEETTKLQLTNKIPFDSYLGIDIQSSNSKIADVYYDTAKDGWYVVANKAGTCILTAKLDSGKTYTCKVTVTNPAPKLNYKTFGMARGESVKLQLKYNSQTVKWSSSNKKIATVNKNGKVTAKSLGKCKITAKVGNKKYTCTINVKRRSPNFDATLKSYNTRGNYFTVTVYNAGDRPLKIFSANAKSVDSDYKYYDRKLKLKNNKNITIAAGKTKTIKFYVKGKTTWPNVYDHTIYYYFEYDGKKYYAYADDGSSCFKKSGEWYYTSLDM